MPELDTGAYATRAADLEEADDDAPPLEIWDVDLQEKVERAAGRWPWLFRGAVLGPLGDRLRLALAGGYHVTPTAPRVRWRLAWPGGALLRARQRRVASWLARYVLRAELWTVELDPREFLRRAARDRRRCAGRFRAALRHRGAAARVWWHYLWFGGAIEDTTRFGAGRDAGGRGRRRRRRRGWWC